MARYVIKRKTYSAIGNTLGGVTNAVGGAMNSTLGKAAGAYIGYKTIGSLLGSMIPIPGGRLIGKIGGAVIGGSLMKGIGKGLKATGQDMMYR